MGKKIRVAVIGVGNCASSLVQGVYHYADPGRSPAGLIHDRIGDYGPADIEFVLAYDTDRRKVGLDLAEAIFAAPNCTAVDRKSTRLNSSHMSISYAVFCLKKKKKTETNLHAR